MTQEEILALPKRKFLIWLRNFVGLIPKEQWCIRTRDNGNGQHCVLGFIDKKFGKVSVDSNNKITDRVIDDTTTKDRFDIVYSNNNHPLIDSRISKLDNPKDRVLKHINLMLANKI